MADSYETHGNEEVVSSGHVASAEVMDDVQLSAEVTEDTSANIICTLSRNFSSLSSVLHQEIASRDVLLQKLEESVTRMAEELSSLKECVKTMMKGMDVESLQAEASPEDTTLEAQLETKKQNKIMVRNKCIEALMNKTKILENNEEKTSNVKGWYEKIYDKATEISYILMILEKNGEVKICIDCDCSHIGRLINRVVDHDGNKQNGTELPAFTDLIACNVYAAGKPRQWYNGGGYVVSHPIAVLTECLTQFAMSVIFKNKGCPYACDDKMMEKVYEKIVEEAWCEQSGVKTWSYSFQRANGMKTQMGKEIMLISAFSAYVVEKVLGGKVSFPDGQLDFLFCFFQEHVVPKMMDYLQWRLDDFDVRAILYASVNRLLMGDDQTADDNVKNSIF